MNSGSFNIFLVLYSVGIVPLYTLSATLRKSFYATLKKLFFLLCKIAGTSLIVLYLAIVKQYFHVVFFSSLTDLTSEVLYESGHKDVHRNVQEIIHLCLVHGPIYRTEW